MQKEKKKSWFRRHWILTIILIIAIISIISAIANNSSNPKQDSNSSETKTDSAVVSGNLESFFPTREEIPTEFRGGAIPSDKNISSVQNAVGLEQAKSMFVEKIIGGNGVISLKVNIYEFLSKDNAQNYYDSLVNEKKESGGYTKLSVSSRATCFGYSEDYSYSVGMAEFLCYNKNIFFSVNGLSANTLENSNSDVKNIISIIDGKIK